MIKQVLTVFRGTVLAQSIGFLILPLLSRLYSSEDFGHYQLFQSTMTFALVMVAARYEIAILRARSDVQARTLYQLALIVTIGVSLVATLASGIALTFFRLEAGTRLVLMFLPIALLFGGWYQTLGYLAARHKAFALGSNARIAQAAAYSASAWSLGSLGGAPAGGLIAADIVGRVVGVATLLPYRCRLALSGRRTSFRKLAGVARKFRDFPLLSMPSALVNSAGGILTPILIYAYFEPATSGQFALVDRAMNFPIGLISVAVSQVFMATLAQAARTGEHIHRTFSNVLKLTLALSIVPTLVVAVAGPWLFELVFGRSWVMAGQFAQILAPTVMANFVQGCVNMALVVTGHQKAQFAWDVGRLTLFAGIWLSVGILKLPVMAAVTLHSIGVCISALAFIGMAHFFFRRISQLELRTVAQAPE